MDTGYEKWSGLAVGIPKPVRSVSSEDGEHTPAVLQFITTTYMVHKEINSVDSSIIQITLL
jgi:hypothetical protein